MNNGRRLSFFFSNAFNRKKNVRLRDMRNLTHHPSLAVIGKSFIYLKPRIPHASAFFMMAAAVIIIFTGPHDIII